MSTFLSGAAVDCGPSDVLKSVGGRLDRDFSLQQDRLVSTPNVAGPSSQPFKPVVVPSAATSNTSASGPQSSAFDLSTLRQHLSPPAPIQRAQISPPVLNQGWASSFIPQEQARSSRSPAPEAYQSKHITHNNGWQAEFTANTGQVPIYTAPSSSKISSEANAPPWQRSYQPARMPMVLAAAPIFQPNPAMAQIADVPTHLYPEQLQSQPQVGSTWVPGFPPQIYQPGPDRLPSQLPATSSQSMPRSQQDQIAQKEPLNPSQDLLAQVARSLIDEASASNLMEANPKLKESKFMALMLSLGKGDVVVEEGKATAADQPVGEGSKFVERRNVDWGSDFLNSGTAVPDELSSMEHPTAYSSQPQVQDPRFTTYPATIPLQNMTNVGKSSSPASNSWNALYDDQEALTMRDQQSHSQPVQRSKSVHFEKPPQELESLGRGVPNNLEEALHTSQTVIPGMHSGWEEAMEDEGDFGEEAFMQYNGLQSVVRSPKLGVGDMENWGEMQGDWEDFIQKQESHVSVQGQGQGQGQVQGGGLRGMRVDDRYLFQRKNPYAVAGSMEDGRESPTLKGVLELEAAVQANPQNHQAWYALGLKQQENERDDAAILALSKVIQLHPEFRPAYLAIAVSYTNEGELLGANTMLEKWITLGGSEGDVSLRETIAKMSWVEGQTLLVERLIDMARENPMEVDADIQVALGVLFNSSHEYFKAEDCFLAALGARPDDWLLYNRLGATLANSGRSNEAISYYHKALALHPNFVRALFNLGISYSNLGQYTLAAQRMLEALRLQHADATEGYASGSSLGNGNAKGVTSETLWTNLRNACLHMGRNDLVALAAKKDLAGFPGDLEASNTYA